MIKILLWDFDGTILDFLPAESYSFKTCFKEMNLGPCTDEMVAEYSALNTSYWDKLELGLVTKEELLVRRFEEFFIRHNISPAYAADFNLLYQQHLGDNVYFIDNAYELIKELSNDYKQYVVTNSTVEAFTRKLKKSGLIDIFDGYFVSDFLGVQKPNVEFFDKVFAEIGITNKSEVLIIGDSLTGDIKGGNNANIATCWYNPKNNQNSKNVTVDFEIQNLWDIKKVLMNQ